MAKIESEELKNKLKEVRNTIKDTIATLGSYIERAKKIKQEKAVTMAELRYAKGKDIEDNRQKISEEYGCEKGKQYAYEHIQRSLDNILFSEI